MIIKKRLIIAREVNYSKRWLTINEGDNFEASFDIDSIGGTLTFELPYIKTKQPDKGAINTLTLDRFRKFDYVYLFYAEVEKDREPNPEEWIQIFNGYIESVLLQRSKDNISYSVVANSMLALSNYYYTYTVIEGGQVPLMPFIILQRANMQSGAYNNMEITQKNLIPIENVYVNINEEYAALVNATVNPKNCKEAIMEFKNKYGLIFTEHMDGMIEVSTLTNHLTAAGNYMLPYAYLKEQGIYDKEKEEEKKKKEFVDPLTTIFKPKDPEEQKRHDEEEIQKLKKTTRAITKLLLPISAAILKIGAKVTKAVGADKTSLLIDNVAKDVETCYSALLTDIKVEPENISETKTKLVNALKFDVSTNVWEVTYPDVSTEYDCVVVYGYGDVGKAIDMTALTLKNILPDPNTGIYQLNTLKLYRKDIASGEFELNRIAREELYNIKQENRIKFQTVFSPLFRVGMPFTFNDYDRYNGTELFICTKISYVISKNDVNCSIEGMSSFLTALPEMVVNNLIVADVTQNEIKDKIIDDAWDNNWQ